MGFALDEQLRALGAAVLLGLALALLYDLLRAVRLRRRTRRALTDALDALYCAALALSGFVFALRIGDGELRLYMLFGAIGGAALFFGVFSPMLRPLWDFWAETLAALWRLLRLPAQRLKKIYGKLTKLSKRLFLFWRNSIIISGYGRYASHAYRRRARKGKILNGGKKGGGAKNGGEGEGKAARRDPDVRGAFRAAGGVRRRAAAPARKDRRRDR